jgi:hypothetical protein
MTPAQTEQLVNVAIAQLPSAIALIKAAFVKAHPDLPMPTDAEVIAAELQAYISSVAKDDKWLAAHPI